MKKLIPLMMIALLGTACDDLEGTIQVQAPLTLKTKKETITLAPGSQWAKFDLDEDDRQLEIKVKDAKGKEKKAELNYRPGTVIPKHSGTFLLTGAESGQSFDLRGAVDTDVNEGPSINTTETCTYQRPIRVARDVPVFNKEGKVVGYRREYYTEYQTFYGRREIRYHNRHTTISGNSEFVQPQTGAVLATFAGSNSFSETINEYTGSCF
jgi:hypothetical protein